MLSDFGSASSAMPPRLQLSYRPRIFPRTVAKTCVLALCLLLWIAYLYSGSYVQDERPRASDNRTGKHGAHASAKHEQNRAQHSAREDILRRPTVPVFEGPAPDTSDQPRCSGGDVNATTRNCSASGGDETNLATGDGGRNSVTSEEGRGKSTSSPSYRQAAPPPPSLPVTVREVRRGDYVVLQQVIRARRSFGYDKSITLTTHATYELLDNLLELSRRWDGPVSVAVYAPHDDFRDSLMLALWLRRCSHSVAELVTFHFVYPAPGVNLRVPTPRPARRVPAKPGTRNSSRVDATPPPTDRCPASSGNVSGHTGNDTAGCEAIRPSSSTPVTTTTTMTTTTTTTEEPIRPYDYVRVLLEVLSGDPAASSVPCSAAYPPPTHPSGLTYRSRHRLPYPINVCRNAARLTARTHFVLASDIELYPSAEVIPMFLNYSRRTGIAQKPPTSTVATGSSTGGSGARPQAAPPAQQQPSSLLASLLMGGGAGVGGGGQQQQVAPAKTRRLFVLPIFEVERSVKEAPSTKRALVELYRRKKAVYFHKYVCSFCNIIPRLNRWLTAPVPRGRLNLFMSIKRQKPFNRWEPIYIGTNEDPLYNELLTWEGQQDKMTQMYEICLLNYDLAILDNAFLVHRPGIKRKNATEYRLKSPYISQNNKIYKTVIKQLEKKHGINPWCK